MRDAPTPIPGRSRARILLVGRGLGLGGMERLLVSQVVFGSRDEFDYAVAYVNRDKDALVEEFRRLDVPVFPLSAGSLPWPLALRALLRRERFDVVHAHSPLVSSVVRVAARTLRPVPSLVYTEHNSWGPYSVPTRWANRLTYRLDDAQFAVSEAAASSVPPSLRGKLRVLDHGIDVTSVAAKHSERAAARRRLRVDDDAVVVGVVANHRPEKNYEGLMRVAANLVERCPDVRFVSVGQGPLLEQATRRHRDLGLGERFAILGGQPDATSIMSAFDVFVLASHWEGLPVAFMEARALGLPVVVTAVGGLPDHVTHDVDGLLVPPRSDDALEAALERVVGDPSLRDQLAAASLVRAPEFDAEHTIAVIEDTYRSLLRSSAGPAVDRSTGAPSPPGSGDRRRAAGAGGPAAHRGDGLQASG